MPDIRAHGEGRIRRSWRRLRRLFQGHRLTCTGCGASVKLPTKRLGTVVVFDDRVKGWTFDSAKGWRCPPCTEVLG